MNEKKNKPVAVCTTCHAYSHNGSKINERCEKQYNGKRCKGIWRSALSEGDWTECSVCNGTGREQEAPCNYCNGFGWKYSRK